MTDTNTTIDADVHVYNPLPRALHHYKRELVADLAACGGSAKTVDSPNEGLRALRRLAALVRHVLRARQLMRQGSQVLVLWPLLGWMDLFLWAFGRSAAYVIVHDPEPLRRQVGTGRFARLLVRATPGHWLPRVIVHSKLAEDRVRASFPNVRVAQLPHPVMPGHARRNARPGDSAVVLGQYKPARDLHLLEELAPHLEAAGVQGRIAGSGWPNLNGWAVQSTFLSEQEFDAVLDEAGCVLIPYSQYFQSGVAIRAIERGVPVVGKAHPFLDALLGESYGGRVPEGADVHSWMLAIQTALSGDCPVGSVYADVVKAWSRWLEDTMQSTGNGVS